MDEFMKNQNAVSLSGNYNIKEGVEFFTTMRWFYDSVYDIEDERYSSIDSKEKNRKLKISKVKKNNERFNPLSIFINNLNTNTTENNLVGYFDIYGEIESVKKNMSPLILIYSINIFLLKQFFDSQRCPYSYTRRKNYPLIILHGFMQN
jgi:RNA recognition motif-containing protein